MLYFYLVFLFFLMIRIPPRSTRTDTRFPYPTLFRSKVSIRQNRIEGSNPSRSATSVPEWAPRLRQCPPPASEAAVTSIPRCEPLPLRPRHAARAHEDGRGDSLRHQAGYVRGPLRRTCAAFAVLPPSVPSFGAWPDRKSTRLNSSH